MIQCHQKKKGEPLVAVGDFAISDTRKSMVIILPTAGRMMFSINLDPAVGRPCWTLSGSDEAPTLTPSLVIPEWHGYLTKGELVTV